MWGASNTIRDSLHELSLQEHKKQKQFALLWVRIFFAFLLVDQKISCINANHLCFCVLKMNTFNFQLQRSQYNVNFECILFTLHTSWIVTGVEKIGKKFDLCLKWTVYYIQNWCCTETFLIWSNHWNLNCLFFLIRGIDQTIVLI